MGDSADLERLQQQVSLIRDLLGRLDEERAKRRVEPQPTPADSLPGRGGLRLVPGHPGPPEGGGEARRPRFRSKRRWDLAAVEAGDPPPQARVSEPPLPATTSDDEPGVPWRRFEALQRERDSLLSSLVRLQMTEQAFLAERSARERLESERRRLRRALERRRQASFDAALRRLYRRLADAEELERFLIRRAAHVGMPPGAGAREDGNGMSAGAGETAAKKLWVRGHEIVVTTSRRSEGGYYSFALLILDANAAEGMKGFKATGASERESELQCIDRVLRYLEDQAGARAAVPASSNLASVCGRDVDIFCDLVGEDRYQAFPFQFDEAGRRRIMLRFHLEEAITGTTAEEARLRCVRRLEEYFAEKDAR